VVGLRRLRHGVELPAHAQLPAEVLRNHGVHSHGRHPGSAPPERLGPAAAARGGVLPPLGATNKAVNTAALALGADTRHRAHGRCVHQTGCEPRRTLEAHNLSCAIEHHNMGRTAITACTALLIHAAAAFAPGALPRLSLQVPCPQRLRTQIAKSSIEMPTFTWRSRG